MTPKGRPMTEETKQQINARAALAALNEAYAYYQPEPVLVHVAKREIDDDTPGSWPHYRAA